MFSDTFSHAAANIFSSLYPVKLLPFGITLVFCSCTVICPSRNNTGIPIYATVLRIDRSFVQLPTFHQFSVSTTQLCLISLIRED